MYVDGGIAFAGEPRRTIKVYGVRPLDNYLLWIRFSTEETKIFDFNPLLREPAFIPLTDKDVFNAIYIGYGVPVWNDGQIDKAPELLLEKGVCT